MGLSEKQFGNGSYWRDLGYPYDPQYERGLRVGDIIAYEGGLVEYENGQVNIRRSNILYQNGAYYTPAPMPEPPKPEPVKPAPPSAASTPKPNTGTTPKPSTSSPGNGGGGGNKPSSKPNTGSGNNGKNEYYDPIFKIPEPFVSNWTLYYFYGEDQKSHAEKNIKLLEEKYTVSQWLITKTEDFTSIWNNTIPKNVDTIIINFHGDPFDVQFIRIPKLNTKQVDTLVLLSCNAGHLHTEVRPVARRLFEHLTVRQFIACDGTHRRESLERPDVGISVIDEYKWKSYFGSSVDKNEKSWGFTLYSVYGLIYSIGTSFNSVASLLECIGKW